MGREEGKRQTPHGPARHTTRTTIFQPPPPRPPGRGVRIQGPGPAAPHVVLTGKERKTAIPMTALPCTPS